MGQKTNPTILRPTPDHIRGCSHWDEPKFNSITQTTQRLVEACFKNTDIYLNNLGVNLSHSDLWIECNCIQLHSEPRKKQRSRRYTTQQRGIKKSWGTVIKRLYFSLRLLQRFTGVKKIRINIQRLKMYTRGIPKPVRQKTGFYTKGFNRVRFNYARKGMQLLTLIMRQKATVNCLVNFVRNCLRTRSRRQKPTDFLRFIQQGLEALGHLKPIGGIKVQIRGRFGHKPKGRSKVWKFQLGAMPLNRLDARITSHYRQAQTKFGTVGITGWVYQQ